MNSISKGLYIVSTPIGNLEDISIRAINVLKNSDIILCEDTRHSIKLLNHYKIKKKLVSHHKFNEKKSISQIIKYLNEGKILSIISDSGTPILSDPGNMLVNKCIENKISVYSIPGASAITTSLVVSGFSSKFLFYGFLPKKQNELEKVLTTLGKIDYSIVFFIPALKFNLYLKNFKIFFSDRKILIAKEMTKYYEEYIWDEIKELDLSKRNLKGELTIVISENKIKKKLLTDEKLDKMILKYMSQYSLKDTVNFIYKKEQISKKTLYEKCLRLKNEKNS